MWNKKELEPNKEQLHPVLQARDASFNKIEEAIHELAAIDKPDGERVSLDGILSTNSPLNHVIRTEVMKRVAGLRLRVANPGIFASDIATDAVKASKDNASRYPEAYQWKPAQAETR